MIAYYLVLFLKYLEGKGKTGVCFNIGFVEKFIEGRILIYNNAIKQILSLMATFVVYL